MSKARPATRRSRSFTIRSRHASKQADIDDFVRRLAATPPGKEILYNLYTPCMFPAPWRADQNQDYLDGRDEIIGYAPDRFFLTQELSRLEKQSGVGADSIKQQLRTIRAAALLALIAPAILFILILAFAFRGWADVARWLGLPLLVGGLVSLLPTLVYQPIFNSMLTSGPMSEAPKEVQTEFLRAFGVLLAEIFRPMMFESLMLMLAGLAITVISMIRKPRVARVSGADLPPPE